jgi:methyltransferase (TIGR00027 family)
VFKSLKRITYQVDDIEKAKQWYRGILQTQPVYDTPFAVIFRVGDCSLSLSIAKNSFPENTGRIDVYWEVDDIDSAFQKLIQNGAKIHTPITQVLNIRIARVVDPFGNIIGLSGEAQKAEKRTVENQPSETAMSVAFCRALAAKDEREELKGPDFLAEIFLTDEAKTALFDNNSRKWAVQNLVTSPLYGYFLARTAFVDSIFISACKDEIPQIVFLGAGYDTRSYRFIDMIRNTKIFELDIATTQQRKVKALKKEGIQIPKLLSFVPVNFKNQKLQDVLSTAGYDNNKKTLFIWEGVTYYLSKEAINDTLHFIANNSPAGSIICFDYMTEKLESLSSAEPFVFWIAKDKIEEMLSSYNMEIIDNIDSAEMERRYLTLRNGTLAEEVLSKFCIAKAILKK